MIIDVLGRPELRAFDDQYTPGIFNLWQMTSLSPLYRSSMLWKPVVYQSIDRSLDKTTLMNVYALRNNISLQPTIDQGIFDALYIKPSVSAWNISLGRAGDGLSLIFVRASNRLRDIPN